MIQVEPISSGGDTGSEKEFVRIEEAASIFGVSRQTMYEWLRKYKIKRYENPANRVVKYVKLADIRAALGNASKFVPVEDESESE